MIQLEPDLRPLTLWRNGLLLALLTWLLTSNLYKQTFAAPDSPPTVPAIAVAGDAPPYSYPPLLALAIHPWDRFQLAHIAPVWFFICVICLVAAVFLFAKASGIELHNAPPLAVMLIVSFYFFPTGLDFARGLFNMPALALLSAAILFDAQDQPYRLVTALAAAALIRPWMAPLLFYPLIRRRPLAFLWGIILFLCVVGLLFARAGWTNLQSIQQAVIQMSQVEIVQGFNNQSVLGFARVHSDNSSVILYTTVSIGFLLLLAGLWLLCRQAPRAKGDQSRLLFSLAVVSLLLAIPVCHRSDFVYVLPALWALLTSDAISTAVRAATVVVYAIFTQSFSAAVDGTADLLRLTPSAYFLAAALLWFILILAIRRNTPHSTHRSAD
jgi:hypothetical protein